jgi:hypothetical protein
MLLVVVLPLDGLLLVLCKDRALVPVLQFLARRKVVGSR